jgi:hypothetical protein
VGKDLIRLDTKLELWTLNGFRLFPGDLRLKVPIKGSVISHVLKYRERYVSSGVELLTSLLRERE